MLTNLFLGQTAEEKLYIEDVFSTWLYTGNGSSQTITNGIDLAGKGGLVWIKSRSAAESHVIVDSARGATKFLRSNSTNAEVTDSARVSSFSSSGFTAGADAETNGSSATYASWTFRKAPKFFDVVTYTGNGASNRQISHSLGVEPGMIIVKGVDYATGWLVWNRGIPNTDFLVLNNTNAKSTYNVWGNTDPTSMYFTVDSDASVNASGYKFVAYLFAHDTTADGVIQCGSFTTDGSGNATVSLGWEPQYVLVKDRTNAQNWYVEDNMRAFNLTSRAILFPNLSNAEATGTTAYLSPNDSGFSAVNGQLNASSTYIYLAIRRGPMRTPTDATKVFLPTKTSAATGTVITTGFPVDMQLVKATGFVDSTYLTDRLRGLNLSSTLSGANAQQLKTDSTAAEAATTGLSYQYDNTSFKLGGFGDNATAYWTFRRAPGFFDVVCYTGTGSANQDIKHNLGAYPDLIIVKSRSASSQWPVICKISNSTQSWYWAGGTSNPGLNSNAAATAFFTAGSSITTTLFKTELFGPTTGIEYNQSGTTYVAYLFASCPGVSKVGSYTGNGSSLNIDCGFTNGARFVLIKRTDDTGDWYVWDTARGIIAANDPHLSLNTTAAEVTTNDTIDPLSSGFTVNQVSATNVNVNAATYIYLAIA